MINEERFNQLVDEQATVYWVYEDVIDVARASLTDFYWLGGENVFETETEAKELLKYGNITRTEKLELPMWEEFCDGKSIRCGDQEYQTTYWVIKDDKHIKMYKFYNGSSAGEFFNKPLTRQNYDLARDLCIKLFKGEE